MLADLLEDSDVEGFQNRIFLVTLEFHVVWLDAVDISGPEKEKEEGVDEGKRLEQGQNDLFECGQNFCCLNPLLG